MRRFVRVEKPYLALVVVARLPSVCIHDYPLMDPVNHTYSIAEETAGSLSL
ncbi:MAG: hypothetical protein KKA54_16205 [Proteobacteria bacterium]|nr:hypothetical protein [Pseudomonadota bacterium]